MKLQNRYLYHDLINNTLVSSQLLSAVCWVFTVKKDRKKSVEKELDKSIKWQLQSDKDRLSMQEGMGGAGEPPNSRPEPRRVRSSDREDVSNRSVRWRVVEVGPTNDVITHYRWFIFTLPQENRPTLF